MARGQPVITTLARWLPVSLVIHAAALAGVVAIPRERTETPLFVDLTAETDPPERARTPGTRPEPARPAGRPRAAVRAPAAALRDAGSGAPAAAPRDTAPPAWTPRSVERPAPAPPPPAPAPPPPAVSPPLPAPAAPPAALAPPPPPATRAPLATAPAPMAPIPAPEPVAPLARPESTPPPPGSGAGLTDSTATGTTPSSARSGSAPAPPGAGGGRAGGIAGSGGAPAEVGGGGSAGAGEQRRGGAGAGDGALALAVPGDGGGEYGAYLALLRRRVQEAVRYPESARRRSLTGTAHVQITLEPSGRIAEVELVRSSSHRALDDAALDGVRALRRIPFPPDVAPRALRVRLPVVFELR
jgi:protein TonB